MKQSTKLLSLILALVLAFSCFSVIGNAALVKTEITYDNIDDADLSPEQVADIDLLKMHNTFFEGFLKEPHKAQSTADYVSKLIITLKKAADGVFRLKSLYKAIKPSTYNLQPTTVNLQPSSVDRKSTTVNLQLASVYR